MNTNSVAVIAPGYVGLPLAVAFGRELRTIGYDLSEVRWPLPPPYRLNRRGDVLGIAVAHNLYMAPGAMRLRKGSEWRLRCGH